METPPQPSQIRQAELKLEISCPECGSVVQTIGLERGVKTDPLTLKCDAFCDFDIFVPTIWVRA